MLALFEFPRRYSDVGHPATGSIDEITWISADATGSDAERVPRGSALYVRGWALDPSGAKGASAVVLTIDGRGTHEARIGLSRADVAASLNNEAAASSGFEALIPTGGLDAGRHVIEVATVDAAARAYAKFGTATPFSIEVVGGPLPPALRYASGSCFVTIDEVRDESRGEQLGAEGGRIYVPRGSILYFRGWGLDERLDEPLGELFAVVDADRAFAAAYGKPRDDVANVREKASLSKVGFDVRIPTSDLERGLHRLEMVGVGRSGAELLRSETTLEIVVGEPLRSRFALDEQTAAFVDDVVRIRQERPAESITPLRVQRGDRVFVRGWAIDESAKALAGGVILLLDDETEVQALYGLPRPDVAERLGDAAFSRCGFTAEIPTQDLAVGMHDVKCRVIASSGRGTLQTAQRFDFEVSELS